MPSPSNKGLVFRAEPLSDEDVRALIGVCSRRAPTGVRNAALLGFLAWSGVRIGEAVAVMPADLDLDKGEVYIRRGKGGTRRVSGLYGRESVALLDRWLDVRRERGLNGRHPVFCTLAGGELEPSYVRHLLPRLASKAGLERRVHPHAFRHTHAQNLMRAGVAVDDIRDQLGHKNLQTTDAYLRQVSPESRISRIREALEA